MIPPSPFDPSSNTHSSGSDAVGQDEEVSPVPAEVGEALVGAVRDGLAQNLLVRRPRAGLRYDVPQIGEFIKH